MFSNTVRHRLFLLSILIVMFLSGLILFNYYKGDLSQENGAPDAAYKDLDMSADLIPMGFAQYWDYEIIYDGDKSVERHKINYQEIINGQLWYEGGSYTADGEFVRNSKDGVHVLVYCDYDLVAECNGDEEQSVDKILLNKNLTAGETYQYSEVNITFLGHRTVTVPAGQFKCLAYKFEIEENVSEECYTPGVGLVQRKTKNKERYIISQLIDSGTAEISGDDLYEYLLEDNWLPALKAYIDQGSDLNAADEFGQTLLHWTAGMSLNQAQVKYIISQGGIDINIQDESGNTPLHVATETAMEALYSGSKPDFSTVATLLQAGADQHIKNSFGETPVDLTKGYDRDSYYKKQFEALIK